jgi:hypothetical protein
VNGTCEGIAAGRPQGSFTGSKTTRHKVQWTSALALLARTGRRGEFTRYENQKQALPLEHFSSPTSSGFGLNQLFQLVYSVY